MLFCNFAEVAYIMEQPIAIFAATTESILAITNSQMELSSVINAKAKSHYVTECLFTEKRMDIVNRSPFLQYLVVSIVLHTRLKLPLKCIRKHLRILKLKIPKISWGSMPPDPTKEGWAFGPLHYTNSN